MEENENQSLSSETRFRMPFWAKVAILFCLAGLTSLAYYTSLRSTHDQKSTLPQVQLDPEEAGRRTPVADFILTDSEGNQKKLSEYHGQVVILSFWASWCPPCLDELPAFAKLQKMLSSEGLQVLPINVDDGQKGKVFAEEFWKKNDFPFSSYFDTTSSLAQQFEVNMLPSNFVIDRQGRLVFGGFGANDWLSQQTLEFITGLLQEPSEDEAP